MHGMRGGKSGAGCQRERAGASVGVVQAPLTQNPATNAGECPIPNSTWVCVDGWMGTASHALALFIYDTLGLKFGATSPVSRNWK